MKIQLRRMAVFAGVLFLMGSAACAQKNDRKSKGATMTTKMVSLSYVFGASLGQNIRQAEIEGVNSELVMRGCEDAIKGDSSMLISMEDGNVIVRNFMQNMQAEKATEASAANEKYMADKAADKDLMSTPSGLYYKFTTKGDGAMPGPTDKVRVNYEGKTTDGEVFDSSYERGQPAEFGLNQVIPGWTEMLQLMPVGSTVEVTIPPALAYGERGSPPSIGPNEILVFKIELIDILPAQPTE